MRVTLGHTAAQNLRVVQIGVRELLLKPITLLALSTMVRNVLDQASS